MAIDEQNIKVENDAITEGQGVKVENSFNIEIKAPVDDELSIDSENPVQNKVVTEALMGKQEKLPSKVGQAGKVLKVSQDETEEEWGEPTLPESPTFKQVTIADEGYAEDGYGIKFNVSGESSLKGLMLGVDRVNGESGLYGDDEELIATIKQDENETVYDYGNGALKVTDTYDGMPVVSVNSHLHLGTVTKLNDYGLFNENQELIAGYDGGAFKYANGLIVAAKDAVYQVVYVPGLIIGNELGAANTYGLYLDIGDEIIADFNRSTQEYRYANGMITAEEQYKTAAIDPGVGQAIRLQEDGYTSLFANQVIDLNAPIIELAGNLWLRNVTTANRPSDAGTGSMIFDTDLGKPIFWNGTKWIDAMGNNVGSGSSYDIEIDGGTF